jgi:hypothetical protein
MLYHILAGVIILCIAAGVYIWIYRTTKDEVEDMMYTEEVTIMGKRTLRHYYKDFEIWEVYNFISKEEAQKCIDIAENLARKDTIENKPPNMIALLQKENYDLIENIGKSISSLMGTSIEYKKQFGVYKYIPGEEIKAHYDGCLNNKDEACNELEVSNIIFLNNDYHSGEIYFYGLNLLIKPETGKMVMFKIYDKDNKRFDRSGYETKIILNGMQYLLR